jgi:hypothetical protein
MKRLLILALIACLVLSLCACTSDSEPTTAPNDDPTVASTPTEPEAPTEPEKPSAPVSKDLQVAGVWTNDDIGTFFLMPGNKGYNQDLEDCSWTLNGNTLRVYNSDTEYFTVDITVQDVISRSLAMKAFNPETFDLVGVWENDSFYIEFFDDADSDWGPSGLIDDFEDFYWTHDGYTVTLDMKGDMITYFILGDCICNPWGAVLYRAD